MTARSTLKVYGIFERPRVDVEVHDALGRPVEDGVVWMESNWKTNVTDVVDLDSPFGWQATGTTDAEGRAGFGPDDYLLGVPTVQADGLEVGAYRVDVGVGICVETVAWYHVGPLPPP